MFEINIYQTSAPFPHQEAKSYKSSATFFFAPMKKKNIRNTASTHTATLPTMKKDSLDLHISNGTNIGFFGEIKS